MKNFIAFAALILVVASCNDYDVEPRYDDRNRFVGYYDVEEYSETYDEITTYEMRISRSRYEREIYIDNFYASDLRVYAIVSYDEIRIPFQIVDGFEIEGSGRLRHGELTLSYRVKDTYDYSVADYCETVGWR
ncbi:MAG: hypothetical protein WA874_07360 [Chryseosolibacter sp.]